MGRLLCVRKQTDFVSLRGSGEREEKEQSKEEKMGEKYPNGQRTF